MANHQRRLGALLFCIFVVGCSRGSYGVPVVPTANADHVSATLTWWTSFSEYAGVTAGPNALSKQTGKRGRKMAAYRGHQRVSYHRSSASWSTTMVSALGGARIDNSVVSTNVAKKKLYPTASNMSTSLDSDQIRFVSSTLPAGSSAEIEEVVSIKQKANTIRCSAKNQNSSTASATAQFSGASAVSVNGSCSGNGFLWDLDNVPSHKGTKATMRIILTLGPTFPLTFTTIVTTAPTTNGRNGRTTYGIGLVSCVSFVIETHGVKLKAKSGHDYSRCPS